MKTGFKGTIIDVRTPQEFAAKQVPGAINIPVDEIEGRIQDLESYQKPIVVYCKSGTRSALAASLLKRNGIAEVKNGGGIEDLLNANQ